MPSTLPETGRETMSGDMSLPKLMADITKGEEAKTGHGSSLTAIERPSKVTKKRYLRPEAPHVGVAVAAQGAALQKFFALPGPVRCPTCTLELFPCLVWSGATIGGHRKQEPRVVAQRALGAPATSLSGPSAQKTLIFGQVKVFQGHDGPSVYRSWSSRAIRGQYLCKYDQEIEISTPRTL